MKKRYFAMVFAVLLAAPLPAFAQAFAQPFAAQAFPALPQSRTCHKDDVVGLWQLQKIYEVPAGRELQTFGKFPFQYALYRPDDTYMLHVDKRAALPNVVLNEINQRKVPWLWQFVVDKSGFLFIYRNGKVEDAQTQACFIVVNGAADFNSGEMLLMPPEGRIKGRLVKVYKKIKELR